MRIAFILLIGCMNAAALLPHKDPGWKRISRPDIDVYDIAYSGSGTIFAFTDGPRVHVLETENYNEVVVYEEHSMDVYSISISHDDTRILSAGKDNLLVLYDLVAGSSIYKNESNQNRTITCIVFGPDDELIAYSNSGGMIYIKNLKTNELLQSFKAHEGPVTKIAYSPDGRYLVSTGSDNLIKLWNTNDYSLYKSLEGHRKLINSFDFNPDGEQLASCGHDRSIIFWNIPDQNNDKPLSIIRNAHSNWITGLKYAPLGNILVSAGHDNRIRLHPLTEDTRRNFIRMKRQDIPEVMKLYRLMNSAYIQKLLIRPGSFQLAVSTLGGGVFVTDSYDQYYQLDNSLLK